MAGSVSQQLEELLNPLPKFADPENDQDDETKAQVDDRFDEDDHEDHEDGFGLSNLRKHNTSLLAETDRRYVGKAVSRKQLLKEMGQSDDEEGDDDDDEEEDDMTETRGEDDDDDDDEEDEEIDSDECDDIASGGERETQDAQLTGKPNGTVKTLVSNKKRTDFVCAEGVDLQKLTEGMDDLGASDDDDGSDDDDDDDDGEEDDDDDDDDSEDEDEDQGTVKTFSKEKVDEEVEKGKAVKNQLILWDQLLEGRIKIQKALATANQLPQPTTFPEFKRQGGADFAGALKNSHKALKALQRSLVELQDQLLHQNPDTRPIALGKTYGAAAANSDDELSEEAEPEPEPGAGPGATKRKLDVGQYPGFMAKRFAAFQPYCNGTLQKWHDKTRLTTGKSSKGFGAFERNIVTQVEQVLLDKERLLRRTQTRRTEYRVLGKRDTSSATAPPEEEPAAPPGGGEEEEPAPADEQTTKANRHLKDLDEDIFDDDDFYHQLLRELIERKTSAADPNDQVAMGRQWLAIQKLRSKIKKRVDTKASKGRKVRFTIHSKLVNFMAPVDHSPMNDEARTELFRCLFGKNSPLEGPQVSAM